VPAAVKAYADPIIINQVEAAAIVSYVRSGHSHVESSRELADQLLELGLRSVVMTLGADGAIVGSASGIEHVRAPKTATIDTTGAGDVFAG
jgi:ribokinase